jgi:hypothetical protein
MDKNPFSLYDFLGYVIPGLTASIFFFIFYNIQSNGASDCFNVTNFISYKDKLIYILEFKNVILLVIISYIIGHLLAFVSSLTIEKFALWHYKYPSVYLFSKKDLRSVYFKTDIFKKCKKKKKKKHTLSRKFLREYFKLLKKKKYNPLIVYIWKIILFILLMPIAILSTFIGRIGRINNSILKPLDECLQKCIIHKKNILLKRLDLFKIYDVKTNKKDVTNEDKDNLRIIYHYQYERNSKQSRKMDNYIALYGFLRSQSLIFVILFDYILLINLKTIKIQSSFNMDILFLLGSFSILSYIFYLAFLKFYRRYTLECYMALVTDESLIDEEGNKKKSIYSSETYS